MAPFNPILKLFGTSPIKPLQTHMAKVMECVAELRPLIEAVVASDAGSVDAAQERIASLEDQADELKHELRLNLPRTYFLPVERRDLLEVLTMQDNVANRAKDIAGLIRGRHMALPDRMGPAFVSFVDASIDACAQAERAVNELDELVETGFRGAEVQRVREMLTELDRLEKKSDNIQVEIRASLFAMERELPPIDVVFLYRIIELIGDVGDCAQRVGSRLQLMLAR